MYANDIDLIIQGNPLKQLKDYLKQLFYKLKSHPKS